MKQIMITLNKIKEFDPCEDGWEKVYEAKKHLGMDVEFPVSDILETNDLQDTLWALECLPEHSSLWRKYAVWCALQVEHLMTDERSKNVLVVAWDHSEGLATEEDLAAARGAACDAAWAAACDAACDAACAAARGAACDAARGAACDAAWAAACDAACAAALSEARAAQSLKLKSVLDTGECER